MMKKINWNVVRAIELLPQAGWPWIPRRGGVHGIFARRVIGVRNEDARVTRT